VRPFKMMSALLHHLYELVGERAVLLPLPKGKKRPTAASWQKTTFEQTQETTYQRNLESACERGGNIGALLGPASSGLVAIDIDCDEEADAFLNATPQLAGTLRTRGARGCQIWLRIVGEYPALKVVSKLKKGKGSVAEWRGGNGHQSVLWGIHPEKMPYHFIVEAPVAAIRFEEIPWPEHWGMDFSNDSKPSPVAGEGEPQLDAEAEQMDDVELTPELKLRIEKYLDKIPPAVSGQGGHNQTYHVAAILVWGFSLAFEDAEPFMRAYSKRCIPQWSEKEIDHKLVDAHKATDHKRPRGYLLAPEEGPPIEERPCYRVHHDFWSDGKKTRAPGVYLHDFIEAGDDIVSADLWLCTPLDVLATTATREDGEHGYLVEFTSRHGRKKRLAIPARCFAGETAEVLGELLAGGLEIWRPKQKLIVDYIAAEKPVKRYAAALSTGWYDDKTFVLPDEVIGSTSVWYQGRDEQSPYGCAGSFASWQQEVAARAVGNPNLIVGLCAGLAGPLLHTFNIPGAGLNFVGPTTIGKTTILDGAQSNWGGEKFKRSWESTAVGLQAIALLHTDTLLVVDELGIADPKTLGSSIYALLNGAGKSRGNVHARARAALHWRVFILSSGEVSAETHLISGGVTVRMGQAVRLLDVPAEGSYGAFDNLHGFADGAAFSDAVRASASCHYGHAGPRFVRALIESEGRLNLPMLLSGLLAKFPGGNDAQARAARTFAVLALAGELARGFGIFPWEKNAAINACVALFDRWKGLTIAKEAASPASKLLSILADFIERFGDDRFSDIDDKFVPAHTPKDRAGYWKSINIGSKEDPINKRVYFFTSSGLKDATKGHELNDVIAALKKAQAFTKIGNDGRTSVVTDTPSGSARLYHIDPSKLR
jgi:uncharacterized protein (DUF927 family)